MLSESFHLSVLEFILETSEMKVYPPEANALLKRYVMGKRVKDSF